MPIAVTQEQQLAIALIPATAGGDAWILLGQDRPGVTVSPLTRVPGGLR